MKLDARGYLCPMPVVMVQKEIKANSPVQLEVLVDNQAAVENVSRFAVSSGYKASVVPVGRDFLLRLTK